MGLMLRPSLRPTPGSDMVDSTATVLVWAMAAMAMELSVTDMERGLLMLRQSLRPMPGSDMVDSTATVLVLAMDMERGLLMLRPNLRLMPGLDMVDSMATVLVWAMAAMVMEVLATDTARGPLTPSLKLMPGTDTVASTATDSQLMEHMVLATDMVASTATDSQPMVVMATDCGERSKHYQKHRLIITCNKPNDLIGLDP